jgi:hypothetical protein
VKSDLTEWWTFAQDGAARRESDFIQPALHADQPEVERELPFAERWPQSLDQFRYRQRIAREALRVWNLLLPIRRCDEPRTSPQRRRLNEFSVQTTPMELPLKNPLM